MTEQNEFRISANEAARIVLEYDCGAEISLDMTQPKYQEYDWKTKALECPICRKKFDSVLKFALDYFSMWLDAIQKSGEKIYFRIKNSPPN